MKYYVEYNGKLMHKCPNLSTARIYAAMKGWRDDALNSLRIISDCGDEYSPLIGASTAPIAFGLPF